MTKENLNDICIYDPLVELTKAFQDLSIQDFKKHLQKIKT